MKKRVLLLHGNFESPSSWQFLDKIKDKSPNIEIDYFNIWNLFKKNKNIDSWDTFIGALCTELVQESHSHYDVVMGYSMGGRILLNLLSSLDNIKGKSEVSIKKSIFLSTHPGLEESDKEKRVQSDLKWKEKVLNLDWTLLLKEWNKQEVFERYSIQNMDEAAKSFADIEIFKNEIAKAFEILSLGKMQTLPLDFYMKHKNSIIWVLGSEDKKFLDASEAFNGILNQVIYPNCGHRIHHESKAIQDSLVDLLQKSLCS